jgi:hypothetical protein
MFWIGRILVVLPRVWTLLNSPEADWQSAAGWQLLATRPT